MEQSFEEAFAASFRPIYRYLRRRVGAAEAEDLAEATFATAFANWDRRDLSRPVRPWLYGIAANLLRHHWRAERRMLRAYARTGADPVLSPEEAAIEHADAALCYRRLARALASLRADDREIVFLRMWTDLSESEIAAALELPLGTVKSRLHRALAGLRNQIEASGRLQSKALLARPEEQR